MRSLVLPLTVAALLLGRVPGRGVRSWLGSNSPVRPEGRAGLDSAAIVGLG